ncbi:MAG: SDR family NAD(P)-dependent oxidoreductase [Actinomycetota bacterium]|nr:MAG: SDR family NAD(P)-dependent oxidoreductase [Actinomycetota bacterium]
MDEARYDGQVAIVTGSARGLGRAHAGLLAARGAAVVINDLGIDLAGGGRSLQPAEQAVAEIVAAGGRAVANGDDIATSAGAAAAVEQALDEFGRLDIVVNNAGIANESPLAELSYAEFENMVRVHAGGHFNVTAAAWPHFVAQGYGRVVMTTSSAIFGTPQPAYTAAKAGVYGLTRSFALLGASVGVRVNAVNPAAFTRLADVTFPVGHPRREAQQQYSADLVAPLVGWLSHRSCTVNGEVFECRAGSVARVFLGLGAGMHDPELSVESVAENIDRIMAVDEFTIPADNTAAKLWLAEQVS